MVYHNVTQKLAQFMQQGVNMLNASLAVIKWKKLAGFYVDYEREHHTTYTLSGNMLLSEDHAPE
jgi:hypothetical protein